MANKLFTFILMPFDAAFDDIYKLGIKDTCESLDVYCERVDEQIFEEKILDRIYNQINKADIVIADMTGRNPNVFYETGYAHALNKRVILLTQSADDIPFDLKHYHHIVYEGKIVKLKEELVRRISWMKSHPSIKSLPNDAEIDLFINGTKLEDGVNIELANKYSANNIMSFANSALPVKIDIHNNGTGVFDTILKIGMIVEGFNRNNLQNDEQHVIPLSENKFLYLSGEITRVFPSGWVSFDLVLLSDAYLYNVTQGETFNITVQVFTEIGVRNIPITIHYKEYWEPF